METSYEPGGPHDQLLEALGTGEATERQDGEVDYMAITPPDSPLADFAPRGPIRVKKRFRDKIPSPLNLKLKLDIPNLARNIQNFRPHDIQDAYSFAVQSTAHRYGNRNAKFMEVLKHTIWTSSQLDIMSQPAAGALDGSLQPPLGESKSDSGSATRPWTLKGAFIAACLSFAIAALLRWWSLDGHKLTLQNAVGASVTLLAVLFIVSVHLRRQWLEWVHDQTLVELNSLFRSSTDFDSTAGAACSFIVEVELVARGYRISMPLPPVSLMEKNDSRNMKSRKMRHALLLILQELARTTHKTAVVLEAFSLPEDVEGLDIAYNCRREIVEREVTDLLHTDPEAGQRSSELKEACRIIRDVRRMFLVRLLCLDPRNDKSEHLKFTTALEGVRECNRANIRASDSIKKLLLDNDMFSWDPKSPSSPMTPGHSQWQSQVRKIGQMNIDVRNLQAKLALLAEDSSRVFKKEQDTASLGSMFLDQYESIGEDLRSLMQNWEDGKASLQKGVAETDRRRSMPSSTHSRRSSLGFLNRDRSRMSMIGLSDHERSKRLSLNSVLSSGSKRASGASPIGTLSEDRSEDSFRDDESDAVPETPEDTLAKLEGHISPITLPDSPLMPEVVFEAIALDKRPPRSLLTREERIAKKNEERQAAAEAKKRVEAGGYMMKELKNVLQAREDRHTAPSTTTTRAATMPPAPTLAFKPSTPN